ncbi:ATP-binding cassette domain-containing protein [Paenibacillus sp. MCAF20]
MVIDIKGVSWDRGDKTILQQIDWKVQEGEHWCLLGLNGSGKTTLLNMINGYIWPTVGQMEVLGKKFGEFDLRELRKSIGWVSTSLQQKLYGSETAFNIVLSGKFATIGLYDRTDDNDSDKAEALMTLLIKDGTVFAASSTDEVLKTETMSEFFGVPVRIEQHDGRNWLTVKENLWN